MATKVIAVHTVQRATKPGVAATRDTKAVRPVIEEIKPGTVFVIDDDEGPDSELAILERAGAVRKPAKGEKISVDIDALANDTAQAPAPKSVSRQSAQPQVEPLTAEQKEDLVARGKALGVTGITVSWKDETLTRKVKEAEDAKAAEDAAAAALV